MQTKYTRRKLRFIRMECPTSVCLIPFHSEIFSLIIYILFPGPIIPSVFKCYKTIQTVNFLCLKSKSKKQLDIKIVVVLISKGGLKGKGGGGGGYF